MQQNYDTMKDNILDKCHFCKQLDVEKFRFIWDLYCNKQLSLSKAAELLGITRPTFRKYRRMIFEIMDINESLPFLTGWENWYNKYPEDRPKK